MTDRPVFHPDLGKFFVDLREKEGWSQSDAARFAQQRGFKSLTRQVLLRLEAGKTKNLEPRVIRELAEFYGKAYREIAQQFVAQRYGRDLFRHGGDQGSDLQDEGRPDAESAAAARIQQLEDRVRKQEDFIGRLEAATRGLFRMFEAAEEDRGARSPQSSRRRTGRKTG